MTYASAADVLRHRLAWATALLAELLAEARSAGWIPGEPTPPAISAAEVRTRIRERFAATPPDVSIAPMEWLRLRLELSEREADALWLLICVEVDPGLARLAQVFGNADCPDLSVQIWQQMVPTSEAELDHLVRLALVETTTEPRLPRHRRWVRAADRVLELVRGELRLDPGVASFASLAPPLATRATPVVDLPSKTALLVAVGVDGAGRATLLRTSAYARGVGVLELRVSDLARDPSRWRAQLRAAVREAMLFGVIPLLCGLGIELDERTDLIQIEVLAGFDGLVMATATASPSWVTGRSLIIVEVTPLSVGQRAKVWSTVLSAAPDVIDAVAERYAISPGAIVAASRNAEARVDDARAVSAEDVHIGLRAHLGQKLGALAKLVEWRQTWEDLVLPDAQREQVEELCARIRFRRDVLETQGFGRKTAKGHGVVALLSGEPGTGKTMVAGLIAAELGLDLYQVDLSAVVSKYIGETEKGLARLFDAAESGHIVLLFDEADALFAKRSEVTSSNDRYANLETNYLLQRLEAFTGITLLTTNHDAAIDDAFRRRIAVHVKFPMPEEDERAELWRAMIPDRARIEPSVDLEELARDFDMSGGHIKNAMMRAAFVAAARGVPIDDEHLRSAARAEFEAMGRISTRSDL